MEVEEEMFVVECIIGRGKDVHGDTVYRVKWSGYPDEEATWEPQDNLPREAVEAYEAELSRRKHEAYDTEYQQQFQKQELPAKYSQPATEVA